MFYGSFLRFLYVGMSVVSRAGIHKSGHGAHGQQEPDMFLFGTVSRDLGTSSQRRPRLRTAHAAGHFQKPSLLWDRASKLGCLPTQSPISASEPAKLHPQFSD